MNAALDTNMWAQVPLEGSNDVTIIRFRLPQGQITIFNIYNDCTHSDTLGLLQHFLDKNVAGFLADDTDQMIWCGDFNHHRPLWDKEYGTKRETAICLRQVPPPLSSH